MTRASSRSSRSGHCAHVIARCRRIALHRIKAPPGGRARDRLRRSRRLAPSTSGPVAAGGPGYPAPLTPRQSDPLVLDSNQTYRFQLEGGDTLLVHDAHVEGDSVAWNEKVSAGTYWTSQRKTIPVSSIQGASVQRADIGATAKLGLFALLAAAVAAVGGAVAFPRY